jgi:hypothetical protein
MLPAAQVTDKFSEKKSNADKVSGNEIQSRE